MLRQTGFTLIELLVVIAVIGILAAIAMPIYSQYRNRAYEASAITYMRNWVPAQELYLQKYGHYADADEQLQTQLHVLSVPRDIPYDFSVDSTASAAVHWWGRGTPLKRGLRYFYIDERARLLGSFSGPPVAPPP
jgi:type IV pilus assembly protein PilA